jgi:hypothetical protein
LKWGVSFPFFVLDQLTAVYLIGVEIKPESEWRYFVMNGKRAIKNNERNHPVKKSLRLKKKKVADLNMKEQLK